MSDNITIEYPRAERAASFQVGPAARVEFDFDRNDATIVRNGQDLLLDIGDIELTLEGFFNNFKDDASNPFVSVKDFLSEGRI